VVMTVLSKLIVGSMPVVAVRGRLVTVIPWLVPVISRLVLCEKWQWARGSQGEREKGEYDASAHGVGDSLVCGFEIDVITADPLVPGASRKDLDKLPLRVDPSRSL
jgi:hypothetical protein